MRLRNATALVTGREDRPTNGKERTHGQRRKPAERNEEETGQNDGGETGREAGQEKRLVSGRSIVRYARPWSGPRPCGRKLLPGCCPGDSAGWPKGLREEKLTAPRSVDVAGPASPAPLVGIPRTAGGRGPSPPACHGSVRMSPASTTSNNRSRSSGLPMTSTDPRSNACWSNGSSWLAVMTITPPA